MRMIIDLETHFLDRAAYEAQVRDGWPEPVDIGERDGFLAGWPRLVAEYPLRPGAREAVWILLQRGWDLHFMTGLDSDDLRRIAELMPSPLNQAARYHRISSTELGYHDFVNWVAPASVQAGVASTQRVWTFGEGGVDGWTELLGVLLSPPEAAAKQERAAKARKAASESTPAASSVD